MVRTDVLPFDLFMPSTIIPVLSVNFFHLFLAKTLYAYTWIHVRAVFGAYEARVNPIPSTEILNPVSNSRKENVSRCSISFACLHGLWRKSLRNGSWAIVSSTEKALYRCALWIARERGCIVNRGLVAQVLEIVGHLLNRIRSRIAAAGKERARLMLRRYSNRGGVFGWAPQVTEWLRDATYIFYLGVNSQK